LFIGEGEIMKEIKFRAWDGEKFRFDIIWESGNFHYYEVCTESFCGCQEYGRQLLRYAKNVN
jgi:hypothetical protein